MKKLFEEAQQLNEFHEGYYLVKSQYGRETYVGGPYLSIDIATDMLIELSDRSNIEIKYLTAQEATVLINKG